MYARHINQLLNKLECIITHGYMNTDKHELTCWFGKDCLNESIVWKKIYEFWNTICTDSTRARKLYTKPECLLVLFISDKYLIIQGDGIKISENSAYRDMRDLAGIKYEQE